MRLTIEDLEFWKSYEETVKLLFTFTSSTKMSRTRDFSGKKTYLANKLFGDFVSAILVLSFSTLTKRHLSQFVLSLIKSKKKY